MKSIARHPTVRRLKCPGASVLFCYGVASKARFAIDFLCRPSVSQFVPKGYEHPINATYNDKATNTINATANDNATSRSTQRPTIRQTNTDRTRKRPTTRQWIAADKVTDTANDKAAMDTANDDSK
jgi:hypothetical protein